MRATALMNLDCVTRSEISQSQKAMYCRTPLMRNVQYRQLYKDRQQTTGYLGLGRLGKECGVTKNEYEISF
jgi:hypothetical protein